MTVEANHKLRLAVELRQCVQNEELELYYQPQVDLVTGDIIGVEALLRWHHPERGLLSPFHFIDVAEERSIIHDITQWVVETGCQQLKSLAGCRRQCVYGGEYFAAQPCRCNLYPSGV